MKDKIKETKEEPKKETKVNDSNKNLLPFEVRALDRKILVKTESKTNPAYGKNPYDATAKELLNKGIIILDKPSGPTSHQAVDYAKRILNLSKAGHSGTLDPGVTGVLPIALQAGTRITHALLTAGKEYICLMHIHSDVDDEALNQVIDEFTGRITQLPPKKSAVKRQLRDRSVYYMEILERDGRDVLFLVGCEAGTYIRKLVHDIGLRLGSGAHMMELRRTKAGPFKEFQAVTLQNIADAFHYYQNGDESLIRKMLIPIEEGASHLKKIWIQDAAVDSLCHGAFLKVPGISKLDFDIKKGDVVAVLTLKDELVLVGDAILDSMDMKNFDKGIAVKTSQVFLEPGIYPKHIQPN
jgi:H/ACA ribonucleoprotein complex subunit 4